MDMDSSGAPSHEGPPVTGDPSNTSIPSQGALHGSSISTASDVAVHNGSILTTTSKQPNQGASCSTSNQKGAVPQKRKAHTEVFHYGHPYAETSKKVKLGPSKIKDTDPFSNTATPNGSHLSIEVWQHIFTFCDPRTLGRLLRVNKLFSLSLGAGSSIPGKQQMQLPQTASKSTVQVLKPDAIWQASRHLFLPKMPGPLLGKAEIDMWRLVCSMTCDHCGKADARDGPVPYNPQHPGPGMEGVAIIWSFATRSCGPCLLKNSTKEIDLMLSSSTPSALIPALPYVVVTPQLDVFSAASIERGKMPSCTDTTKIFWSTCVDSLKHELDSVKETLGPAATEEWLKGLEGRGIEHRTLTSKWEKFAIADGVDQMRTLCHAVYGSSSGTRPAVQRYRSLHHNDAPQTKSTDKATTMQQDAAVTTAVTSNAPPNGIKQEPDLKYVLSDIPQSGQSRTLEEVTEMKSRRRAEIERRALLLDSSLTANVLAHLPAFHAALQITSPLDDNAWKLLVPRLLAQRTQAEQTVWPERQEGIKGMSDQDYWDAVQAPIRARLSGYADDLIRTAWDDGEAVNKGNAAKFAADILISCRNRFYADVARDAAVARAAGQEPPVDPPEGPFTQKLILENMKWLFESKISPYTSMHRKDLFYCNACKDNTKVFKIDGVIQHYAAKHTTAMSVGNIIVSWKNEWPSTPPFRPDPDVWAKKLVKQKRAAKLLTGTAQARLPAFTGSHGPHPVSAPSYPSELQAGHGTVSHGSRSLPQPLGPSYGSYSQPRSYAQPSSNLNLAPHHSQPSISYPTPVQAPVPANGLPVHSPASTPGVGLQAPVYLSGPNRDPIGFAIPPQNYQVKLQELARDAKDLWQKASAIKDLKGSAKLHVILHHLTKRFHAKFSENVSLGMFNDGLSNHKEMRPVRNVNGLSCKACQLRLDNSAVVKSERQMFSFPQLVNHFEREHSRGLLEWTNDMLLLPDISTLSGLRSLHGVGGPKYDLVSEALPDIFVRLSPSLQPQPEYRSTASVRNFNQPRERGYRRSGKPPNQRDYHSQPGREVKSEDGEWDNNAGHKPREASTKFSGHLSFNQPAVPIPRSAQPYGTVAENNDYSSASALGMPLAQRSAQHIGSRSRSRDASRFQHDEENTPPMREDRYEPSARSVQYQVPDRDARTASTVTYGDGVPVNSSREHGVPVWRSAESVYGRGAPAAEGVRYERPPPRAEGSHTYPQYEVIRLIDADGPYELLRLVSRQPGLNTQQSSFEFDDVPHRDLELRHGSYGNPYRPFATPLESPYQTSQTSLQSPYQLSPASFAPSPVYGNSIPLSRVMPPRSREQSHSAVNPALDDEYDPHFPAASSGLGPGRHVRYH